MTAIIVERSIHFITGYKYSYIMHWFSVATKSPDNLHISLLVAVGLNAGICFLAAVLGMMSPVSCGSGIPHIKVRLFKASTVRESPAVVCLTIVYAISKIFRLNLLKLKLQGSLITYFSLSGEYIHV